ncbi:MAG: hypothetical protein WBF51_04300 [Candidatus Dormiibacterota bacterium]
MKDGDDLSPGPAHAEWVDDGEYSFEVFYFESIPAKIADDYWAERGGRPASRPTEPR